MIYSHVKFDNQPNFLVISVNKKFLLLGLKKEIKILHIQPYFKKKGRQCQVKQILLFSEYKKERE